jgi:serine phosphatase RsbU (regulator of sigma subunit)
MAGQWLHHPSTIHRAGTASLRPGGATLRRAHHPPPRRGATAPRSGHHRWLELGSWTARFPEELSAAEHLSALRDFARQAAEASEPAELLWRLCALCTETLGLEGAQVYLVTDARGEPRVERVGSAGELSLHYDGATPPRVEELIAGYRHALILRGAGEPERHAGPLSGNGDRPRNSRAPSVAVLPLRSRGRSLALLALSGRLRPFEWHAEAIPALTPYLRQAAAALDHLLAERESQQRVDRLTQILLQVSRALVSQPGIEGLLDAVGDALLGATSFDTVGVFLHDAGTGRLQARSLRGTISTDPAYWAEFAMTERLPGFAALDRAAAVEIGIQRDSRPEAAVERALGLDTLVSAPLLANEQLHGVLSLGALQPHDVSREDMDLVQAVANQLAVAVANARLREEMRRRIEEQERAARELSLLYDTSRAVVGTLELEDRLQTVAAGLMQATGTTHCAIFRMEREGLSPWLLAGGTVEETKRFLALDPPPADASRLLRMVKSRRAPFTTADKPRDPFVGTVWKQEFGIRSAVWLPLLFQNRITGVALVYRYGEYQEFTQEQLHLARAVSNQAAVALRLSQAYEHERNIAVTLQAGLGPTVAGRLRNFDVGHAYHPALQEAHVGGDIYDAFVLPDERVALLMADVSGKGLDAAVQTTTLKNMLRAFAFEDPDPPTVFARLNKALYYYSEPHLFVTAFYGVLCLTTGVLTYSNAGHDCPLLYAADAGFCTSLDTTGIALGMDAASVYASRRVELAPGDVLLLYTDGVTEARANSEFFGRDRLEDLLLQAAGSKPSRIVASIYRAVRTHSEGELHDDIALLVVKAKPSWKSLVRS